jgi:hypothetical protein
MPGYGQFINMNYARYNKNIGKTFGFLTIICTYCEKVGKSKYDFAFYTYKCICGKLGSSRVNDILLGKSTSCGCIQKKLTSKRFKKHGMVRNQEYKAYYSAKTRCKSKKYHAYKDYGGRGIEFKFKSFEEFYQELGPKPHETYQLDRIDNNGHYEKGNVRWVTPKQNSNNRRKKNELIPLESRL